MALTVSPFIRIITKDTEVVSINPAVLATFQIKLKAKLKRKVKAEDGSLKDEDYEADCLNFFFTDGHGLQYIVGQHITEQEFNYVCSALQEMVYMTVPERISAKEAAEKAQIKAFEEGTAPVQKTE